MKTTISFSVEERIASRINALPNRSQFASELFEREFFQQDEAERQRTMTPEQLKVEADAKEKALFEREASLLMEKQVLAEKRAQIDGLEQLKVDEERRIAREREREAWLKALNEELKLANRELLLEGGELKLALELVWSDLRKKNDPMALTYPSLVWNTFVARRPEVAERFPDLTQRASGVV